MNAEIPAGLNGPGSDDLKGRTLVAAAKKRHFSSFLNDSNILGAGYGRRTVRDERTDEPALVVYVARKIRTQVLPLSHRIPRRLYIGGDVIEVDVVETGPIYPLALTERVRPVPAGVSIASQGTIFAEAGAGTLGCLVTDNTDRSLCILSNNHVIARSNLGAIGQTPVRQPSELDGGLPFDFIATLKRFIALSDNGTNLMDAAIAEVVDPAIVTNEMAELFMDPPSPTHPAVGLIFATCGAENLTFHNPISDVLRALDVSLLDGAPAVAEPVINMHVEKVGRTSAYTTGTVLNLDDDILVGGYDNGPGFFDASFSGQFSTTCMARGGDSGSVSCVGGTGVQAPGCATTAAAENLLGTELSREEYEAKLVRDKYLRHTRVGSHIIDVFYHNEERLLVRYYDTQIEDEDRDFARRLFKLYGEGIRQAFFGPHSDRVRISAEHLDAAHTAVERASKYMKNDEYDATRRLLKLADRTKGYNITEILTFLNDPDVFIEVQQLIRKVDFFDTTDL